MDGDQVTSPEEVADRLIELGYFKFLPEAETEIARRELVASLRLGYLGTEWDERCVARDRRGYPADSEELAEGGIGQFLALLQDVLGREGVRWSSVADDVREEGYDVVIDGQVFPVFDGAAADDGNYWEVAAARFLEIVNELLQGSGSAERLYAVYGGNDGRAVLLTEEMYGLVISSGLIADPSELPRPPSTLRRRSSATSAGGDAPRRVSWRAAKLVLFLLAAVALASVVIWQLLTGLSSASR